MINFSEIQPGDLIKVLLNIDDVDDWQTIEDGYVDIIKNYTKDCIENNKVTKERAKLICNTQGIY